ARAAPTNASVAIDNMASRIMIPPRFPRAHYSSPRRPPTKPALCAQMSRLAAMARNKKGSDAALDDDRLT
ncbi:MAG TPA: hypothetical protein VK749_03830, partial [Xanthobacteraceae bacterium]|nr:hypothetical protein [Xanthobacteraceae bacterium]